MKWPWVSRRYHEYCVAFFDEMTAARRESDARSLKIMDDIVDQLILVTAERDRIRAEANTMKGRLHALGDEGHKVFGPYFEVLH